MKKHLRFGFTMLAVMVIATGCVSTGTFEKMQADKNGEIAALQKQRADLENQKKGLEEQKGKLEQDNAAMKQQNAALDQKNKAAEQEKAALLAASQQRQQQYDSLVQGLSKEVEKGQLQVRQYQNMLSVDLAEQIFFDSGKAAIKKEGKDVLKKVADALKGYESKIIRVVGHTDNVPLSKSATFASNWELSVARATTVVRFLQDSGIPPERLVPSGRGEYEPVAPNDTPEGRQKNRRIEIMLIDKSLVGEMSKPAH